MLKKSFLLGLVAFSALGQAVADQSNCATISGLRVGAGLGMAYGSANAKVDTTGVAKYSLNVPTAPTNPASFGMRGQSSYKSNVGKAGLAGELFIEYLFHVGGTAYAGLGIDFHNGTSFMSAKKDRDTSGTVGSFLPINTKVKSVWGFSPAVIFGLQLNPTTLLRFSIGPSFDKYKAKTTPLTLNSGEYIDADDSGIGTSTIPQADIAAFNNMPFSKYNKTKVGVKIGFGIETLIHKNVVLRLSASAIFGPKIKMFDDFSKLRLYSINSYTAGVPGTPAVSASVKESPFPFQNASQKITMRRYDITLGVAYKM